MIVADLGVPNCTEVEPPSDQMPGQAPGARPLNPASLAILDRPGRQHGSPRRQLGNRRSIH